MSDATGDHVREIVPCRFTEDDFETGLACMPGWVPAEYRNFLEQHGVFHIAGVDWLSPASAPNSPFSVESGHEQLTQSAEMFGEDPDRWFPVAIFDLDEFALYHLKDDGSTEFGHFHFEDLEYVEGPFPTMTDWMRTYTEKI